MENGINIKVIWFDRDMIEIVLSCSNGYFSGQCEICLGHDELSILADGLSGFPIQVSDFREFKLGTFDPNHADGGALMSFRAGTLWGMPQSKSNFEAMAAKL